MIKKTLIALCFVIAAFVAQRQYSKLSQTRRQAAPLATRLTFDYKGPLKGLFEKIESQTSTRYVIDPEVANLPIEGSFKNKSLVQIQSVVAQKLPIRYRPPAPNTEGIQVQPRKR
jgi:hypothetical protein